MKENIEIQLNADVNDIREIYFRDNRQKYFLGPETKRQSIYLIFAVLIFPFFAIHALKSTNTLYFVAGCIFFSFIVYDYWKAATPILKWKKSVHEFLKKIEGMNSVKFTYNDSYFIHDDGEKQLKQEWSVIERAQINERFIWLFSNTHVLLPKSAMTTDEFEALSSTVMNHVKNVEKQ